MQSATISNRNVAWPCLNIYDLFIVNRFYVSIDFTVWVGLYPQAAYFIFWSLVLPEALKADQGDILVISDETLAAVSKPLLDRANELTATLSKAAQNLTSAPDRVASLREFNAALRAVTQALKPVGQSISLEIALITHDFVMERDAEIRARDPLAMNTLEMHVASLIMAIKRRMICARLPMPMQLTANLAALRDQMPSLKTERSNAAAAAIAASETSNPVARPIATAKPKGMTIFGIKLF
jgi:hypothetical protein